MIKLKRKKRYNGFTMIELMVALAIFSLIAIGMMSVAISTIKSQRRAFSIQIIEESSRYILESIIKEIRMSVINTNSGSNLTSLNVTNIDNDIIEYQFYASGLRKRVNGGVWQDMTSDEIELTGNFYVRKSVTPNNALVTISMRIRTKNTKLVDQADVNIQNTIASRSN